MNLVPDRWYAVLDSREVPAGRPAVFQRLGRRMVFWRAADGSVRAADDRCPHRSAGFATGKVVAGELRCPFHGFRFDGDGRCTDIPAHPGRPITPAMRLRTYAVREAHDLVWVWNGDPAQATGEVPFFDDLKGLVYEGSQRISSWPVHYTRAVENQLDFAHLAFVHESTIGRFAKADVDESRLEQDGDRIKAWVEGVDGFLEFHGPNVWRLVIRPDFQQFLAFVPIDDAHMLYYIRAYQGRVTAPGLRWLYGKLNGLANLFVLRQDERVVVTQEPKIGELRNGEVLVPSDRPIIEYRRWRERNRRAAAEPSPVEAPEPLAK